MRVHLCLVEVLVDRQPMQQPCGGRDSPASAHSHREFAVAEFDRVLEQPKHWSNRSVPGPRRGESAYGWRERYSVAGKYSYLGIDAAGIRRELVAQSALRGYISTF